MRQSPIPNLSQPACRITLDGVREMETMNGIAYGGRLWFDGELVGTFQQDGNGGATMFRWTSGFECDREATLAYVRELGSPFDGYGVDDIPDGIEGALDGWIATILDWRGGAR